MCSFWALYVASVDAVLEFRLFAASFAANRCPESDGLLLSLVISVAGKDKQCRVPKVKITSTENQWISHSRVESQSLRV